LPAWPPWPPRGCAPGQAAAGPRRRLPHHRPSALFHYELRAGYDGTGRILGAEATLVARAGHSADLSGPVMTRALCHFDNAYWLPHVAVHGYRPGPTRRATPRFAVSAARRVRSPSSTCWTAWRAAWAWTRWTCAGPTSTASRPHNVTPYGQVVDDNILHELVDELAASSDYRARRAAIAAFNATSPVLKKGLALTPLKFGISSTWCT
jgi:xanthine dehydrogenase large subunit